MLSSSLIYHKLQLCSTSKIQQKKKTCKLVWLDVYLSDPRRRFLNIQCKPFLRSNFLDDIQSALQTRLSGRHFLYDLHAPYWIQKICTIQTTEQTTIKINKTPQKPYLWINTAMVAQFNCRSSEVLSIPASKHLANLLQLRKVPTSRTGKYKTCYCFS